jgi:hypothetical protein
MTDPDGLIVSPERDLPRYVLLLFEPTHKGLAANQSQATGTDVRYRLDTINLAVQHIRNMRD